MGLALLGALQELTLHINRFFVFLYVLIFCGVRGGTHFRILLEVDLTQGDMFLADGVSAFWRGRTGHAPLEALQGGELDECFFAFP